MLSETSNKRSTLFSAFIGWINHVIYTLKYSARSAMSSHVQNQTSKWHNPICDGQVDVALPVYHILIYFISVILVLERLQRSPCVATSELVESTTRWFTGNTLVPSLRREKLGPRLKVTWGYWVRYCTPKSETRSRWRLKTWHPGSFLCIHMDCFTGTHGEPWGHWNNSSKCFVLSRSCVCYCPLRGIIQKLKLCC